MRKAGLVGVLIALMLALVSPAAAITYGQPDTENLYPYVGVMVARDEDGNALWRCSGSLISPTVFLTAGHCVYGAESVMVWFEQDEADLRAAGYPLKGGVLGEPIPHPLYDDYASFPVTYDVGLVLLKKPVKLEQYGELAPLGFLDELATSRGTQDVTFTTVGYGLQSRKPELESLVSRYYAWSTLINLSSYLTDGYNLMTTNNPGRDSGGNCSGDSGGPILYSTDTHLIVAVNSFGMAPHCKGNDYAWRTDIAVTLDFIYQYYTPPTN